MIDLAAETIVTLTDACKLFPARRKGKKPAVATLHRWVTAGCRGVKLEMIQVGGTRCTSVQAIQRFCERLTAGGAVDSARTSPKRQKEIAAAKSELAAAGY